MGRNAVLACMALVSACLPKRVDTHLIDQLDGEVAALEEKNAILTEKLASCPAPPMAPEIFTQLQQVFSGTEIAVSRTGSGARVTFPAALLFPPNSVDVRQEAAMGLDLLATAILRHPELRVWIVGHADAAPTQGPLAHVYPGAWEWSVAQALAVMKALHARYQVPVQRFAVAGRGSMDPISTEDSPEEKAKNRRVEVLLVPVDP